MKIPGSRLSRSDSEQNHPPLKQDHRRPAVWIPLITLAAATALILLLNLDLRFQRFFFTEADGWWMMNRWFLPDLYDYGTWPAIGLIGASFLICIFSLPVRYSRRWLRPALFLLLMAGLGPGLVVNAIFKANFGRPRPNETEEFGRYRGFLPLLKKGEAGKGTSFPSGHAAMGFYLMSPYFLLLARRRHLARLVLFTGLIMGSLVGLSRISAGDHFLGDVLWSWGFVYFSGLACYYLFRLNRKQMEQE